MSIIYSRSGDDIGRGGYHDSDDKFITFTLIFSILYLLRGKRERKHSDDITLQFM